VGLRAHGIRFGAHHIYMPLLLKPAPRALSLLLWGLKHGGLGQKGISELPTLAASGRTSIPLDPEIAKPLYRAVGYRVCGSRALRVDILERLADLIRPALSWRPGMPGEKPAGAADGRGFTVTVAMTSLVGCAGEDFSAILRALGYRMERRPAPPPEVKPEIAASATLAPDAVAAATAESPQEIPEINATAAADPLPQPESAAAVQPEPTSETMAAAPSEAAQPPTEAAAAAAPSAEPAMIEVWRAGRPREERKPPRRRERERRIPQASALPAAADVAPASEPPAQEATRDEPHRHKPRKRDHPQRDRRPGRAPRPDRDQHPPRERNRERPIDPNSPFAALLELKARLEAAQKNES
jgi:ATP-dependent RNA helicase SUPV3L1/SUV3